MANESSAERQKVIDALGAALLRVESTRGHKEETERAFRRADTDWRNALIDAEKARDALAAIVADALGSEVPRG